jgi:hypothetical protein
MIAAHGVERIDTVEDVHFVPASAESARKPVDVRGVSAEAMCSEEGGYHAEFQR